MRRRDLLFGSFALFGGSRIACASPDATFSSDVKVVNVFATVRNKHGEIIRDLKKDDFTIDEDGRAQTIRYFSQDSDLPLTLGLLVDTSGSQRRVLGQEQTASYAFLDQVLREGKDMAFLIHFDREVELLQDLTSSRKQLQAALDHMEAPDQRPMRRQPGGPGGPGGWGGAGRGGWGGPGGSGGGRRRGFGGTSLYDAVLLASDELMKKQSGRKALVLLSDGVDNGSKVSLNTAVEAAQRADTLVYSILFADPDMQRFGGGMGRHGRGGRMPARMPLDGKKILERISKETGGGFFEVSKKHPMEATYDQIQQELRHQYSLGYTPDGNASTAYRHIHVQTKQRGLTVQAREGYYPG